MHNSLSMRATCVDDLPVYQRAKAFFKAIIELTPTFRSHLWLADQLNESAESTLGNIAEGFRQPTDRAFARFLTISSSSAEESRTHLLAAEMLRLVGGRRSLELRREAKEIADMLEGFIRYLYRCDRKDRLRRIDAAQDPPIRKYRRPRRPPSKEDSE